MIFIIILFTFCPYCAEWSMLAILQRAEGSLHYPKELRNVRAFLRKSLMTGCVALKNDASMVVGKGICHNVSSDLVIDSDNQPLRNDRVIVQIAESLSKHNVPSGWLFQLRSWHIKHVFLNGASLYDHQQMNLFNLASLTTRQCSRVGAHLYDNSRE